MGRQPGVRATKSMRFHRITPPDIRRIVMLLLCLEEVPVLMRYPIVRMEERDVTDMHTIGMMTSMMYCAFSPL